MKAVFALAAVFVAGVAAQAPSCAAPCLSLVIGAGKCSGETDFACLCTAATAASVTNCLNTACPSASVAALQAEQAAVCPAFVTGASSGGASSASAGTAATGSAAATGTASATGTGTGAASQTAAVSSGSSGAGAAGGETTAASGASTAAGNAASTTAASSAATGSPSAAANQTAAADRVVVGGSVLLAGFAALLAL